MRPAISFEDWSSRNEDHIRRCTDLFRAALIMTLKGANLSINTCDLDRRFAMFLYRHSSNRFRGRL